MESRLRKEQREALLEAARKMTPEQRLKAFAEYSRLLAEIHLAGQSYRSSNPLNKSESA